MIVWNDSMLIGIPDIDNQHKDLMVACNQLFEACTKGKGRTEIEQTLNFVVTYTKKHFKYEENYQAQHMYPGATPHKWMHTQFIMQVGGIVKEFNQNGPSVTLVSRLNNLLVEWLYNHINIEDRKLGEFISRKSA